MPATPAMIGFVSTEYRAAIASDPAVKTLWGDAARDTSAERSLKKGEVDTSAEAPVPTFFDLVSDAQAMAEERLALLKQGRRLFEVSYGELLSFSGALAIEGQLPTIHLTETAKAADLDTLLVSIDALDFETGKTTVQQWG